MSGGRGVSGGGRTYLGIALCIVSLFAGCQERQIRIHFEEAEKHRVAGDLKAAAAEYMAVVEMDSTQSDAQNNLGHLYAKMGRPDSALHHYQMALAANTSFAEAHFNKGVLFVSQGLTDSAIASYKAAVLHDSSQAEAYNNLGVLYERLGDIHSAIDQYALGTKQQTDFAPTHTKSGEGVSSRG
jgi:tetratricopeptide (TPR) repeat protein